MGTILLFGEVYARGLIFVKPPILAQSGLTNPHGIWVQALTFLCEGWGSQRVGGKAFGKRVVA